MEQDIIRAIENAEKRLKEKLEPKNKFNRSLERWLQDKEDEHYREWMGISPADLDTVKSKKPSTDIDY